MVTQIEAKDMRDAIKQLEVFETQQAKAQQDILIRQAEDWFRTLGININSATTRNQALRNFQDIKILIESETERFKKAILRKKLEQANEKYKEVKRNG